jgi:hypothetical protein
MAGGATYTMKLGTASMVMFGFDLAAEIVESNSIRKNSQAKFLSLLIIRGFNPGTGLHKF